MFLNLYYYAVTLQITIISTIKYYVPQKFETKQFYYKTNSTQYNNTCQVNKIRYKKH